MADSPIRDYRDLRVWQEALKLAKLIYQATKDFPKEEIYGLTNQMRRAAVSISSNIAEGHSRGHLRDYIRFIDIARGSVAELESQSFLANELSYLGESNFTSVTKQIQYVRRQLSSLKTALQKREEKDGGS